MSAFFVKSILSLLLLITAVCGMYTMFEVFGRTEPRYSVERLKSFHRSCGLAYILLFVLISILCISVLAESGAELTSRATLHSIFALAIVALLGLKSLFVRVYRQYYLYTKTIGVVIGVVTILLVGLTAGYYFVVTKFGTDLRYDRSVGYRVFGFIGIKQERAGRVISVRTDRQSIEQGNVLFQVKCAICHDAASTTTVVGPGLKGLLRNPKLPVSNLPATPQNVMHQLRQPLGRMPSFAYLTDEEMANLLAYLNTL
jgi:energy-converting hydrogenase Eha subunit A